MPVAGHTLLVTTADSPGVLSTITQVIAAHPANIRSIESLGPRGEGFVVDPGLNPLDDYQALRANLLALSVVQRIEEPPPLMAIYGKRIIIMGGGAQVGQVASGDQGSRSAQHPRRAHLGRHDSAGGRRDAGGGGPGRGAPAARAAAGLAGSLMGARSPRPSKSCSGPGSRDLAQHGRQRARCRRPGRQRSVRLA